MCMYEFKIFVKSEIKMHSWQVFDVLIEMKQLIFLGIDYKSLKRQRRVST